jgi:CubicO group peptidase (beta-lactamase class C family)
MRTSQKLRWSLFGLSFPLLITVVTAQPSPQPSAEILSHIHQVENNLGGWVKIKGSAGWNIHDRMRYYRINGLTIAVIHDYNIEWAKAYGWADTARKSPASTETLFQAASVGKSINAAATMILIQKGHLDPDRDINSYLHRWKFPYDSVSHGKIINTKELLSHMAGLSTPGFDGYCPDNLLPTTIQTLDGVFPANNPPVRSIFEPGRQFQYSGGGYTISGLIDEEISGEQYADFIRHILFQPLGMTHSFYQSELSPHSDGALATAYRWDRKPIGCRYHVYPEEACGAGLWTTPTDFAKLILELQRTMAGKGGHIFTSASVKQLLTPQSKSGNALGFFIEKRGDRSYFHHDGLNEGFISDYYASMTGGDGVVIMANTDLALYIDITEELINSVATVYHWRGFYTPVTKIEESVPRQVLNDYVGRYRFRDDADQFVDVYWQDSQLWFHDTGSPVPWRMHFTSEKNFFFYEVYQNDHEFTRNAKGKVDGFIIHAADGSFKVKKVL